MVYVGTPKKLSYGSVLGVSKMCRLKAFSISTLRKKVTPSLVAVIETELQTVATDLPADRIVEANAVVDVVTKLVPA